MPVDKSDAVVLTATNAVGVFGTLLPSLTEVRKATPSNTDMADDVRHAEIMATVIVVGVGVLLSSITNEPNAAVAAVISSAIMVGIYEYTLQRNPSKPIGKATTDARIT